MDFMESGFDLIAIFGIPIIIGIIVYLWFDRMLKKAIIVGLVVLLLLLVLGWNARVIMGWII